MSKLDELINELCPDGVEYVPLWSITIWDKKFNAVDRNKQKKVYDYHYFFANELEPMIVENGDIKILTTSTSDLYTTEEYAGEYIVDREIIAIPGGGNPNIQYYNGKFITSDNRIATSIDTTVIDNKFIYYYLQNKLDEIGSYYRGAGIKHPDMARVLDMKIPLPPIEVQLEIVRILDKFTELTKELTKELTARKKQYEYYRDELLKFDEGVERKTLGELCNIIVGGEVPLDSIKGEIQDEKHQYPIWGNGKDIYGYASTYLIENDAVCISSIGANTGAVFFHKGKFTPIIRLKVLVPKNNDINNKYLFHAVSTINFTPKKSSVPNMSSSDIKQACIYVPSLDEQIRIANILDRLYKLCNDLTEGLPAEIAARQK
ncbi:MAG: restriction endonuclease subunit S, partial [Bacteroidetes bacterium]|nr:restriction endonuclease subunit S [Bacteroidota bacterium]